MRAPSSKRLQDEPNLTPQEARLIRKFAKAADDPDEIDDLVDFDVVLVTWEIMSKMYHRPDSTYVALLAMDDIMHTYGIETIPGDLDFDESPDYEYLNAGDTYAATLIYNIRTDTLRISTIGDILERAGSRY